MLKIKKALSVSCSANYLFVGNVTMNFGNVEVQNLLPHAGSIREADVVICGSSDGIFASYNQETCWCLEVLVRWY